MEIRDVIHGSIQIEPSELVIIDSPFFQRLRNIRQLGFAEHSFPSATHNRFIHSLGAMRAATRAFDGVFADRSHPISRFRSVLRLAALLHDIGHGPLSHTTEFAMPLVQDLELPLLKKLRKENAKATHEDYTLKIILNSSLTPLLKEAGQAHGFKPIHLAALIEPGIDLSEDPFFFEEMKDHGRVDFRPILQQMISSELDADRMDYLRRDSLQTGVSYGQFDFDWLVGNLTYHIQDGKAYLCLHHRALYAFEDFLISRFHMFLMVYFHHKTVIFDEMLRQYLLSPGCEFSLPASIEDYCEYDDSRLQTHLAKSTDPWARRISEKRPYRMLLELHSGIPPSKDAQIEQEHLLAKIQKDLKAQEVHYVIATSTGELSKYFMRPADPIFVRYDNHYNTPNVIPIEECTDLFQKYAEKRSITRLYVAPEDYHRCAPPQNSGH